jgi:hypothetical protein
VNGTTRLAAFLGTWGRPIDTPAKVAFLASLLLLLVAAAPPHVIATLSMPVFRTSPSALRRRRLTLLGFLAAFLSLGYIAFYLRGGPRIIDATSYFLEGRLLSYGQLSWPVPEPLASFHGRFLLAHDGNRLSVIFPPGYPLLLAVGFLLRAPLVVGPLLAAALVGATYALTRELVFDHRERSAIALFAAALSVVSAALRYHTADTMAHGASALGITVALGAAFFGARTGRRAAWVLAGLMVGWVFATRPVSSFAVFAVCVALAARRGRSVTFALATLPGVLLLFVASHAQAGRWFVSPQAAYYAVSDGPPGCFAYGFGADVGCLGEHGDFVRARLPHGFGLAEAALTTLRRLRVHLFDIANFEPLALLVLVPAFARRLEATGRKPARVLVASALVVVVGQVLAYAPFYFDGDYPGGGARFFADVLPIEHALMAVGVALLVPRVALVRRALAVLGLAALGFAVHGAYEHEALAQRDGGRPFYVPEDRRGAVGLRQGLLFFDTDHGFDLAYDPYADLSRGTFAARLRGDDHDRLLSERLGRPAAHVYKPDPVHAVVTGWTAPASASRDLWRFEAEAEWPPRALEGDGWAEPVWASNSCAVDGRVLTLHVTGASAASARFDMPVPRTARWVVTPRVMARGGPGRGRLELVPRGRAPVASDARLVWEWDDRFGGATEGHDVCAELPQKEMPVGVDLDVQGADWVLTATGGDVSLDETIVRLAR